MRAPRSTSLVGLAALTLGAACLAGCAGQDPTDGQHTPPGLWFDSTEHQALSGLSEEQREALEHLFALGYAEGYEPAPQESGVTVHVKGEATPGARLYCSGHGSEALLIDEHGALLHRWAFEYVDLPLREAMQHSSQTAWRRVRLLADGDLLAIHDGLGILRLDRHSKLRWYYPGRCHHDLDLDRDGRIWVLTRRPRLISQLNAEAPLLEEFIEVLDSGGTRLEQVSLYEALLASRWSHLLREAVSRGGDVLHTNSLELVDERLAGRLEGVEAGQALVCMRELAALAVVDLELERVVWLMQGEFGAPHDPSVLENGNLLLFDNMGHRPTEDAGPGRGGTSRIVEVDPTNGEILWLYAGEPPESFLSIVCGAAQRLPTGGTLITESCSGRAFEVARDGRKLWGWASPHRAGPEQELVACLFEMTWLGPEVDLGWLR